MHIRKVLKLFAALNSRNKILLLFYVALVGFFKLTGKRLLKKTRLNVLGIDYEIRVGMGELNVIYHTNILKEYMELEDFIPEPNSVCVDIGANIGSTALAWTQTLKAGKIYAIEPHPETYLSLLRNIEINGVNNTIYPRQLAVGEHDGKVVLTISDQGTMAMRPGHYKWRGREIVVRSITVDSFTKEEEIDSIDILKIDIEGFEAEALGGAEETLNITKRVVLEYHSPELRKQCLDILVQNGFKITERGTLIFCSRN